jgi:hypothetical protein
VPSDVDDRRPVTFRLGTAGTPAFLDGFCGMKIFGVETTPTSFGGPFIHHFLPFAGNVVV